MRTICCNECGKLKPTHPEDAARGLFPRRTHGRVIRDLICDLCGKPLPMGTDAVAESVPRDMPQWEHEYLTSPDSRPVTPADIAAEDITEGRSRPLEPNPHDD